MDSPGPSSPAAARPAPRSRRLLTASLSALSWSYLAAVLALWGLLRWGDLWWPATVLIFAPRWPCALPLLVLAPAAWLLRRKALLAPLALAALVVAGPVTGLCVPWRALLSPAPAGPRLRVLTCNLHGSKAVDPRTLEALVRESGADVVALQEWPEAGESSLGDWPGWHRHAAPGLFLASRFPVLRVSELGEDSYGPEGSVARYDLDTPAGEVHVFSLHLASPREGLYEAVHEGRAGAAEVVANSARRREQSEYVARHAGDAGVPVLLAGDFNTPPESALFRDVWGGYADAFAEAGWGWGYTFAGGKTLVRIDHVLAGEGWRCAGCWVGPDVGSPHRPVLADLVWTAGAVGGR